MRHTQRENESEKGWGMDGNGTNDQRTTGIHREMGRKEEINTKME